jgi:hypothetical protein
VRHFNGREIVHDDPQSSRPFAVNEDLLHAVEEKIQENRRFIISSHSLNFPQISQSLLLMEFFPQGSTVNAGVYCDTLKKLRRAIQDDRCDMLSWGVVMLHDNVRPHTVPQCKISSRHLAGNNSIISPTAQTMVETMSKSSVRYVHQMAKKYIYTHHLKLTLAFYIQDAAESIKIIKFDHAFVCSGMTEYV